MANGLAILLVLLAIAKDDAARIALSEMDVAMKPSRKQPEGKKFGPFGGSSAPARLDCGTEYSFGRVGAGSLPDLIAEAHTWCRSDRVPEHKRVPPKLRGLYWMKDVSLSDVAMCFSLAEWDHKRNRMSEAVWSTFVVRKEASEVVPQLIKDTAGRTSSKYGRKGVMGWILGSKPLVYTWQFSNSSLDFARIRSSAWLYNAFSYLPTTEVNKTSDGEVVSEQPGDIFERVSYVVLPKKKKYYAVRLMDDNGKIHKKRLELMRKAEASYNVTYMRYDTDC